MTQSYSCWVWVNPEDSQTPNNPGFHWAWSAWRCSSSMFGPFMIEEINERYKPYGCFIGSQKSQQIWLIQCSRI